MTLPFRIFHQLGQDIEEQATFRHEHDAYSYAERAGAVWLSSPSPIRVLVAKDDDVVKQFAANCEPLSLAAAREAIRTVPEPEKADWRERVGEGKGAVRE